LDILAQIHSSGSVKARLSAPEAVAVMLAMAAIAIQTEMAGIGAVTADCWHAAMIHEVTN